MRILRKINVPTLLLLGIAAFFICSVPESSLYSRLFWYQSSPGEVIDLTEDVRYFASEKPIDLLETVPGDTAFQNMLAANYDDLVTPNWCMQVDIAKYTSFIQHEPSVVSFDYHMLSGFRAYLQLPDGSLEELPAKVKGTLCYVVTLPSSLPTDSKLLASFEFSPTPFNVSLWHDSAFHRFEDRLLLYLVFGLTITFAFLCVNIFLYDVTGAKRYLIHFFALLFALTTSTLFSGVASVLFGYQCTMLVDSFMALSSSLSFLFSSIFVFLFFKLKQFGKVFLIGLCGIVALTMLFLCTLLLFPPNIPQSIFNILSIAYYLYHISAVVTCLIKRYPISRYYLIGVTLTIACLVVYMLSTFAVIPLTFFSTHIVVFSIVPLEAILFTVSIFDQVKVEKRYAEALEYQAYLDHSRISALLISENQLNDNLLFLQNLIDSIPFPIYFSNQSGDLIGVNQKFTKLTGQAFLPDLNSHFNFYSESLTKQLNEIDLDLLHNPRLSLYEYSGPFFHAPSCSLNFFKSVFFDKEGYPAGVVTVIVDVTTVKEAEAQLRNNKQQLEQLVYQRTQELHRLNEALNLDIEQRKVTESSLQESQTKLRELATELTLVEERERRAISTYIHDNISQSLALSKIIVNQMEENTVSGEVKQNLHHLAELIGEAVSQTRSMISDLGSPILHEYGLYAALESLGEKMFASRKIKYDLNFEAPEIQLNDRTNVLLYAICKELIYNIIKHANASYVHIKITIISKAMQILVCDNGVGFNQTSSSLVGLAQSNFGLFSIRERLASIGGSIHIESASQSGTKICLEIPLIKDLLQEL